MAVDVTYGYGINTVSDPDKDLDPDKALRIMVQFILNGVSPLEKTPEAPAEYGEQ